MALNSNIETVIGWLEDWVKGIDFTKPGMTDESLGKDVAMVVITGPGGGEAGGIMGRSLAERRGMGVTWAPNRPAYAAWKQQHYGVSEPNSRTGQMLSQESLYGQTEIESDSVTMRYGTGQPPASASAGTLRSSDQKVTDTQKAEYAHGKSNRPFYGMEPEDTENVIAVCAEWLDGYVHQTNREH